MANPRLFMDSFGPENGRPLLFFHGFPGSHLQAGLLRPWVEKFDLRVLAVDRPGYGFSPPLKGGLQAFIGELDRLLEAERFYAIGVSGGNAAALTAAAHFGPRVLGLACVCGVAPFEQAPETYSAAQKNGLNLARRLPLALLRPAVDALLRGFDPQTGLDAMIAKLSAPDRKVLADDSVRQTLLDSMTLARRQGSAGILFDLKSFANAWPLRWEQARCPTFIWHGERDSILSSEMAHFLAARLPHARLKVFPDEGHYSLPIQRAEDILRELVGNPP